MRDTVEDIMEILSQRILDDLPQIQFFGATQAIADYIRENYTERDTSTENLRRKQAECVHAHVDKPGSVFGETCTDCGLYLNNGV